MKKTVFLLLSIIMMAMVSCSSKDELKIEKEKDFNIEGMWEKYAYKSDGTFWDISDVPNSATYYEFSKPDIFKKYDFNHDVVLSGKWSIKGNRVHIEEPRGWNLDILVEKNKDGEVIFYINGKTEISNSTIKVKKNMMI